MTYQFKGKCLFWAAGLICIVSLVLSPVGVIFIYMAMTAYIRMEDDVFVYKMLTTKRIPYRDIKKIYLSKPVDARYKVGYAFVSFATVIPLNIEYGDGKKTKISLNYFENSQQIAEILEQKTGLTIGMPE